MQIDPAITTALIIGLAFVSLVCITFQGWVIHRMNKRERVMLAALTTAQVALEPFYHAAVVRTWRQSQADYELGIMCQGRAGPSALPLHAIKVAALWATVDATNKIRSAVMGAPVTPQAVTFAAEEEAAND